MYVCPPVWGTLASHSAILFSEIFEKILDILPVEEDMGPPQYYFYDIAQNTNNAEYKRIDNAKRTDFTFRLTQYIDAGSFGSHEIGAGFSYYKT